MNFYLWGVGQTAVFRINATNTCGTTTQEFGFRAINCNPGGGGGGCNRYQVSTNPASGSIKVEAYRIPPPCDEEHLASYNKNGKTPQTIITEIRIYDQVGNIKLVHKENKTGQATINLNGLKTGVYTIEISDGTYKEKQQVIIL